MYMGKDKFENEGLIEWGWKTDLWFHVDALSSAHVYLRVPLETAMACGCKQRCGCIMDTIPAEVIEEMCQLVKANSISGCKMASVSVVYTPHSNLRKDQNTMKDGAVGFHSSSFRRFHLTEKDRGCVKRLEKTRTEAHPDLQLEKMAFQQRCDPQRCPLVCSVKACQSHRRGGGGNHRVVEYQKTISKAAFEEYAANDPKVSRRASPSQL